MSSICYQRICKMIIKLKKLKRRYKTSKIERIMSIVQQSSMKTFYSFNVADTSNISFWTNRCSTVTQNPRMTLKMWNLTLTNILKSSKFGTLLFLINCRLLQGTEKHMFWLLLFGTLLRILKFRCFSWIFNLIQDLKITFVKEWIRKGITLWINIRSGILSTIFHFSQRTTILWPEKVWALFTSIREKSLKMEHDH